MSASRPADAPWSVVDVERLIVQGRYGNAHAALAELDAHLDELRANAQGEDWLVALYARALLLHRTMAGRAEVVAGWSRLETAAKGARQPQWVMIAQTQRARSRLEYGEPAAALGDLARIDALDLTETDLGGIGSTDSVTGMRLLDSIAGAFFRIRIADRAEQARQLIEVDIEHREPMDRAAHWATWATELATRAMEPVARGAREPEPHQLARAVELAGRVNAMPVHQVPAPVARTANAVLALAESFQGHARDALRLLGADGFGEPTGLSAPESQLAVIAALRAHTAQTSHATARSLDDNTERVSGYLPTMILEVCRARERLLLERDAGSAVGTDQAQVRLSDLLVKLSWQSLELLSQTSRQALEHQQLLIESRTDALTGAGNRRALDEVLPSMLRFTQLPLGMVLLDLDRFKRVNYEYTHAVGDEVLRQVTRTIRGLLGPNDKLIRYEGDEFVILLEGAGDAEARTVATALANAVHAVDWTRIATGLRVRATTGHAALHALSGRRPAADAERLFRRADESLLETKRRREATEVQVREQLPAITPPVTVRERDPLTDPLPHPLVSVVDQVDLRDDLASARAESSSDPVTPPTLIARPPGANAPDTLSTRRARRVAMLQMQRQDDSTSR